jgi:hypothetical protein
LYKILSRSTRQGKKKKKKAREKTLGKTRQGKALKNLVFSNQVFKEGSDFTLVKGYPGSSSKKLGFSKPSLQGRARFHPS